MSPAVADVHRRPHPQPMDLPFLEFDFARELRELKAEPEWRSGRNARTLVKYDDFRVVLTLLAAGTRIPGHVAAGRITVQTITGRLRLHADGRTFDLPAGSMVALDRAIPHDVEAIEESAFLLTLAMPK